MKLVGNTRVAFVDGFSNITGRTCAVLMRLGVSTIDEEPFAIKIF